MSARPVPIAQYPALYFGPIQCNSDNTVDVTIYRQADGDVVVDLTDLPSGGWPAEAMTRLDSHLWG